jgi:hypothetical protein
MLWIAAAHTGRAIEMTWEFSVQVSAQVQTTPAQIQLSWPQDQYTLPTSYTIYRKALTDMGWGSGVQLPGTATTYLDSNVVEGTGYEYQVVKTTSQYSGYGYVYAGINLPLVENRGKLLLVVDTTHAADLANELGRLQQDLIGDGWAVVRLDVNRNDSVTSVKAKIKAQYDADPVNLRCVFLFGHVPVAYSGNLAPDGHTPDHKGAWPSDGYYGDMDGLWTDSSVNATGQYDPRNSNVPGDGKFDQNSFPGPIRLMVGRVDLANMPGELWYGGPTTMPSELDLLRNYLNKDHKFRTKQFDLPRRGFVGDFFGVHEGEAFAASGWRNFAPFFGASNVSMTLTNGTWTQTMKTTPCLWAYGCGAGSFTSIAGLGNSDSYYDLLTRELYTNDVQAVFVLFFGSWQGDFDAKDDILRGVLALPSYGLASALSGRPHWFMHHMAMGMPIGYSARLTQNNGPGGLYQNQLNNGAGQIHIALMGDPTLRMHVVGPPGSVIASTNAGGVALNWAASTDSILGYHVYRSTGTNGVFTRLTSSPVTATSFTDSNPAGAVDYMVRAVKLETSGSGTYYNLSEGAFVSPIIGSGGIAGAGDPPPAGNLSTNSNWGVNNISYGTEAASRGHIGSLPATGQRVLLQVPANRVGLEGSTLNDMAFSQFDGRASWDHAGVSSALLSSPPTNAIPPTSGGGTPPPTSGGSGGSPTGPTNNPPTGTTNSPAVVSTNTVPGLSVVDYVTPQLPQVGDGTLHILTPTLLELKLITTKQPDPAMPTVWNLVNGSGQFVAPPAGAFAVTANGLPVGVAGIGFKRRPLYAPMAGYDLRIENSLYLQLASPIADSSAVAVKNPDGSLWTSSTKFVATADALRFSPAIHVNQEGYMPSYSKKAMVGYYAGSLGEVPVPATAGFKLIDVATGGEVFQGSLVQRHDTGYTYTPTPYQQVYEADFTGFNTPGEYRLSVPGMGASLPFLIHDGVATSFARAYALGLYHQRCGTNTAMPFTRFTHDTCHAAPAQVPSSASGFPFTWTAIAGYANTLNPNNPAQTAPALTSPTAQLFPFANQGPLDVTGGHHDAGDYSKYTINSASLVHYLMFAVDSLAGVADLDNLGIPESGDGIGDLMQEAKWEADFLAKMQDSDGGFYFLVYPQNREYEGNVTPDHGDPQVVWPKTTSVTAASVAALAQCASSPRFKQAYPAVAEAYLQKAKLGWQFLTSAISKYGKNGGYQKITHYGDNFADSDELAWAACQMYLATGDSSIHQQLLSWFDPADPATWRWGWWHMSEGYGHAIRSYAFAAQSGRISAGQLDATFLGKCKAQISAAGDDMVSFANQSAYGTSFPTPSKAVQSAGWYFSCDQAFDIAVAYQLNPKSDYMTTMLENMNYEGGCNPVNVCYVTGLGWRRARDLVSQWALNDSRVLPPSGIPIGNVQGSFGYLWDYGGALSSLCFPSDATGNGTYPFYDRWGDSWNVTAEMVVLNQARGLGTLGFLAAQSAYKTQSWKAPADASISVPTSVVPVGAPVTVSLQVPGMDLTAARVTWEVRDQEPTFDNSFTFSPKNNGAQWVEAEAQWPDGRRVFAKATFQANSPNVVWVDDALPAGATGGAEGGDSWTWSSTGPTPFAGSMDHQSTASAGFHQHFFSGATATLNVSTGDVLYAYIYLDPSNPPAELMLQWNDGSWEHRAYWGGNQLGYGIDGTASRRYMGPLPALGRWVQLKVPASQVNLEGSTLSGMAFTLYNGRAAWDAAGSLSAADGGSNPPQAIPVSLQIAPDGATLVWNSSPSKTYQISTKTSLQDTTWTPLTTVTATNATTSWKDTAARARNQRFYMVALTN